MAYDKHTWTCDEPITVERLNHIEDGIANAGGGECGFECEEDVTLLTEENVTTAEHNGYNYAQLSYSQFIDAETIRVTFDGVEYDCPRMVLESNQNFYGGFNTATMMPDFSQYPFVISSYSSDSDVGGRGNTRDVDPPLNEIVAQTAGTHTVKIETVGGMTVTTTPCFDLARGYSCKTTVTELTEESVTTELQGSVAYGELSYSQPIDADSIKVTFDGVEYECPRLSDDTYGALYDDSTDNYDWSEYPFSIVPTIADGNRVFTENAGTYTIKVEAVETTVTTTPCFDKARGYSCEETIATLTEESVTTELDGDYISGLLSYSQLIDAATIKVTFNGTEYDCPRMPLFSNYVYGSDGSDFSQYPFTIVSQASGLNMFFTETAGTYSVKIEALKTNATITSCFEAAVKEANTRMGSTNVPTEASVAIVKRSTGITGSPYAIPANSSATVRFTFSEPLSERAALRQITVPTGILLGKIQPFQSAYADLGVYNVTANSITLTNDNMSMEFIDFEEPDTVCVMMSDACSSPEPSPK